MTGRALVPAALAAVVLGGAALSAATWARDDDRPVDPHTPAARRAAAVAQSVVPGRVLEIARDVDNGKWEVTLRRGARDHEVELAPGDLALLRVDYD